MQIFMNRSCVDQRYRWRRILTIGRSQSKPSRANAKRSRCPALSASRLPARFIFTLVDRRCAERITSLLVQGIGHERRKASPVIRVGHESCHIDAACSADEEFRRAKTEAVPAQCSPIANRNRKESGRIGNRTRMVFAAKRALTGTRLGVLWCDRRSIHNADVSAMATTFQVMHRCFHIDP